MNAQNVMLASAKCSVKRKSKRATAQQPANSSNATSVGDYPITSSFFLFEALSFII
jgi:hypothetical protein